MSSSRIQGRGGWRSSQGGPERWGRRQKSIVRFWVTFCFIVWNFVSARWVHWESECILSKLKFCWKNCFESAKTVGGLEKLWPISGKLWPISARLCPIAKKLRPIWWRVHGAPTSSKSAGESLRKGLENFVGLLRKFSAKGAANFCKRSIVAFLTRFPGCQLFQKRLRRFPEKSSKGMYSEIA